MKTITVRSEILIARLTNESRSLGGLEQRYGVVADRIKHCDLTAHHLSSRLQRLAKNLPRAFQSDEGRVVFNEHRRILREEVNFNNRFRRSSIEEARMIRKEIVEAQSAIRIVRDALESRLH